MASVLMLLLSVSLLNATVCLSKTADPEIFTPDEQQWIASHPDIRIRISRSYPPFEFFADGHYQGIACDYLQVVSERTGLSFTPVEGLSWNDSLAGLRDHSWLDMILLITPTPEREAHYLFSDVYIDYDLVLISVRSDDSPHDYAALAGKTVAVERGYQVADLLRRDFPDIHLIETETTAAALQAVSVGRADAYVGNLAPAAWTIDREGLSNLQIAGSTPYGQDPLAMAVRNDWPQLQQILNKVLNNIPADIHQQIRNRWLPVRFEHEYNVPYILKWLGAVLVLALLWIVQLRFVVRRRTEALRKEIALRGEREIELKMSMEYLKSTHRRLHFNIERMPLGYIVWDASFCVQEWNPAAERIFGWSVEEVQGRHAYELIVPESARPIVDTVWDELKKGDESSVSINENVTADGRRLICSWYNAPLIDDDGNLTGVLSMVEDITQRYEEEKARRQQFEQLSKIFDSINALVYVADFDSNKLLYVNKSGQEIFGGDWQGKKCYEFLQTGQSEMCPFCTNDRLTLDGESGAPYIWEFQNTVNHRWYQCIDRAIPWLDGKLVRMEIAFDITGSKEVEQLKEGMVSAVSHEMRTPLTAIMGYVEYLMTTPVAPDELQGHIRTIYSEAEKLGNLIDSFLNLQQLKSGQQPINFFAVDLCTILNGIRDELANPDAPHRIVVDCPADLPRLKGDPVQVREALLRVASNAIKYSPAGGLVSLSAVADRDQIHIAIRDQGIGIPEAAVSRIFERFYRVDNSDTREFGGVGIGLSLVQDIVATHGGSVDVESTEGEGTTVTLSFPRYQES